MTGLQNVAPADYTKVQREIGRVWIVEHHNPNRASRRSASKERRRKLTAYNAEISEIRAKVAVRNAKRFAKFEAQVLAVEGADARVAEIETELRAAQDAA